MKFAHFIFIRKLWYLKGEIFMKISQSLHRLKKEYEWLGSSFPLVLAGPCSAETEEQVLTIAKQLKELGIDWFRAGIWKPRTRPGAFEGIGKEGLPWLEKVQEEVGLKVMIEVAKPEHVYEALKHKISAFWIGARTTANPFAVQEIADTIAELDHKPIVLIKNPVNPDLNLWLGAVERIEAAGVTQIGCIHRGFSYYGKTEYRNPPHWQIPIELRQLRPDLPLICDSSHICGNRTLLGSVAQMAMDLCFDGLMLEVHPTPDEAWSDAAQQITAQGLNNLLTNLHIRQNIEDSTTLNILTSLRTEIDNLDMQLLETLVDRMEVSEKIGLYKKENNVLVLQPKRWEDILKKAVALGKSQGLNEEFVQNIFKAIHVESIRIQDKLMNE